MTNLPSPLLSFQSRLLLSIHGIADADLSRPAGEEAWSIADVVAHLGDVELITAVRARMMVAQEVPELPGFEPEAWVERVHGGQPVADRLEELWTTRRRNVALLKSLAPNELLRTGRHPDHGIITIQKLFELLAAHAESHLDQIERIKAAVGLATSNVVNLAGVVATKADRNTFRSPGDGVRIHDLWHNGVRRALQVELDAGARWPGLDYHVPGPEEVYVLSGDFSDGVRRYDSGTFIHHPAGTSHLPSSEGGCVLFVYYPEG